MNGNSGTVDSLQQQLDGAKSRKKRLPIMLQLSHLLRVLDSERSLELAEEALEIARGLGDARSVVQAALSVSWHCSNNGAYARSEAAVRIATAHIRDVDDPQLACMVEHTAGGHWMFQGDFSKAFEHLGRALEMSRTLPGPMTSQILGSIAWAHSSMGSYARALEIFTELLGIWTREGNKQYMAMTINSMAGIYKDLKQWDRALELFNDGLALAREIGSLMGEATFTGNIGMLHSARKDYLAALPYAMRSLEMERELGRKRPEALTLSTIAEIHAGLGEHNAALRHAIASLELLESTGNMSDVAGALLMVGEAHLDLGEIDRARDYLERGLAYATEQRQKDVMRNAHRSLAALYERCDDPRAAMEHLNACTELTEQLSDESVRRAVTAAQMTVEVERAEKEREIYRLKADQLERELDHKARELTTMALHVAQKNELVLWLQNQVRPFVRPSGKDASELASILLPKIRENAGIETQWEQFEGQFLQLHPGFMEAIAERYPTLTQMEVRICSLLRINLSNKEIALILGLSVRTVEGHRRFIRKKLGIPSEGNIVMAIASVPERGERGAQVVDRGSLHERIAERA